MLAHSDHRIEKKWNFSDNIAWFHIFFKIKIIYLLDDQWFERRLSSFKNVFNKIEKFKIIRSWIIENWIWIKQNSSMKRWCRIIAFTLNLAQKFMIIYIVIEFETLKKNSFWKIGLINKRWKLSMLTILKSSFNRLLIAACALMTTTNWF